MARGINKVILIGNLGADPEMKYTAGGTAICKFRIATSDLSKGRTVYVEGSLRTSSWDDQDGNKRYMTEINARDVQFLGGQGGGPASGGGGGGQGGGDDFGGPPPMGDEDIPF
ncbi:MAG: single-stranded DNA-binding protein [Desulfarculus sp.]|nr:single-stranded DNA-binding protein [Desulfarculus sp.]